MLHHLPTARRARLAVALLVLGTAACATDDPATPPPAPVELTIYGEVDLTVADGSPDRVADAFIDREGRVAVAGWIRLPDLCHRVTLAAAQVGTEVVVTATAAPYPTALAHLAPPDCAARSGAIAYRLAAEPAAHPTTSLRVRHAVATRDGRLVSEWEDQVGTLLAR